MNRPADETDGRHDFDFLTGHWRVANRRLDDPFDEAGASWSAFESDVESRPILAGLGNIDTYSIAHFPGVGPFQGFALRLFDADMRLWRIWWASSLGGGRLDNPVAGRFVDKVGRFEGDDVVRGRAVRVRYTWGDIGPTSARWEQGFSFDEGETYTVNWIMQFSRRGT